MGVSGESTEIAAFFGTQMLIHLVRNFVAAGLIDPVGFKANVHETIDQGTVHFGPDYHALLAGYGRSFEEAVDRGLSHRNAKGG